MSDIDDYKVSNQHELNPELIRANVVSEIVNAAERMAVIWDRCEDKGRLLSGFRKKVRRILNKREEK